MRRTKVQELAPIVVVAGAAILGLIIGEVLYYSVTNRLPASLGPRPWWFVGFFVVVPLVLAIRTESLVIRAALILLASGELYSVWRPESLLDWALQHSISVAAILLLQIACWRLVKHRFRVAAIVIVLVAIPIRYWSVRNWHATIDRYRISQHETSQGAHE